MKKEYLYGLLLFIGGFGWLIVAAIFLSIVSRNHDLYALIQNVVIVLPYLFAFIFPVLFYRLSNMEDKLKLLGLALIGYTVISLFLILLDAKNGELITSGFYGVIGLLFGLGIVGYGFYLKQALVIERDFLIVLCLFAFVLLIQNQGVMMFVLENIEPQDNFIYRIISYFFSGLTSLTTIVYVIAQFFMIDQISNY